MSDPKNLLAWDDIYDLAFFTDGAIHNIRCSSWKNKFLIQFVEPKGNYTRDHCDSSTIRKIVL